MNRLYAASLAVASTLLTILPACRSHAALPDAPRSTSASLLASLDLNEDDLLRIRGVDGNGIDIRPKHAVPLQVTYEGQPTPSASSPFETVVIELANKAQSGRSLTVQIDNAPAQVLAPGSSIAVTYTYESDGPAGGRTLKLEVGGSSYKAKLKLGSNYGPQSVLRAPVSKLLNRAGDVELLIDVHGLKTAVTIEGLLRP